MPDPTVIVTFYSNCRLEPVDISGIFPGVFGSGKENKLVHVHETINQAYKNPNNPPEEPPCLTKVVEEKDFDETRSCQYSNLIVKVVASSGSWQFEVHIAGEDFTSSPVPFNATAAEIIAAIPTLLQNPSALEADRITKLGDGGECSGGGQEEIAPLNWINVVELGSGEWEFRFVEDTGIHLPSGLSFLATAITLGEVIEMQHFHDETQYAVPLTRGLFGGGTAPTGKVSPHGGAGGSRASPRPISGSRA